MGTQHEQDATPTKLSGPARPIATWVRALAATVIAVVALIITILVQRWLAP
jgi:hypothetical protein